MKQIHFDPKNQEAMNALMDEHGKSKTMYPGTNEQRFASKIKFILCS